MSVFQPPPTWALPILVNEKTGQAVFSPVWLKWFIDLSKNLSATGGAVNATGTLPNDEIVIGAGGTDVQPLGSLGTDVQVLHGNAAGAPTWGPVILGADVRGGLFRNVRDYGAAGDGTTDDTIAIQLAIDGGVGVVWFPPGTYKTTAVLTIGTDGVMLLGAGRGASFLAPAFANDDYIFADTVAFFQFFSIQILPTVAQVTGAGIHLVNCHTALLRDFKIVGDAALTGKLHDCIVIDGGAQQFLTYIEDYEMGNCSGRGIVIGETALVQDTIISNGIVAGCGAEGYLLVYCSGVYFTGETSALGSGGNGYATYPAAGQYVTAVFFGTALADSGGDNGFGIIDAGGTVTDINMEGSWSASNTNHGMLTSAAVNGLSAVGLRVINNGKHGIYLNGGTNVNFSHYQVFDNSTSANNTYDGISIAADVSYFQFTDGNSGHGGRMSVVTTNKQRYGLFLAAGTSSNYVIAGNNFVGNVTGALIDGGTGTNKHVYANFPTIASSFSSTLRATQLIAPTAGGGVEIAYDPSAGPTGWIICYDRTAAAYRGLNIGAASINVTTNGSTALDISSSQIVSFNNSPTMPTAAPGDNTTKGATTAFVTAAVAAVGGVSLLNQNDWSKTQRIIGLQAPVSGEGLELSYDAAAHTGYVLSYDRAGAAYKGLTIQSSVTTFFINGSEVGRWSSSGLTVGNLTSTRVPYATTAGLLTDSANLTFNGTTLTAAGFSGPLTGNVTGNASGSSGSCTGNAATASSCSGNAATATALQTARNINGVSFDGTASITVTAAAGTLSGSTLASGVTASSLTSIGTLTGPLLTSGTSASASAGVLSIGASSEATASAGGGGALPATVNGYLVVYLGSTKLKIPCYLN